MKIYHATKNTPSATALEVAERIEREGFRAQFDPNHQAKVVSFCERPLPGWGGWSDAWVVVEVPDHVAAQYRYDFDESLYRAACYAFPQRVINLYRRYATENKEDEFAATEDEIAENYEAW